MLDAIYTGVSGMNAYSTGLQTISNNVSNLNSNGFKATTVSFEDLFSPGGNGQALTGGETGNMGEGVRADTSVVDFSQGELRQTGNDLDLGIQGNGFLNVVDKEGRTLYTRTGSFAVDQDGFISDQTSGARLTIIGANGLATAANISDKQTSAPIASTEVAFSDNLSSSGTTATVSNINVFDDNGGQQVWTATFTKVTTTGPSNSWNVVVTDANGNTVGTSTLSFTGSSPDSTTDSMVVSTTPAGADPLSVTLDFSGVTSFSSGTTSTITAAAADGNGLGTLNSVTVDDKGQLTLTYSNQQTAILGTVAMADFRDPQQLSRIGNGLYQNSNDIPVQLVASGTNGIGTLTPQTIEASNVDLSGEFGDLILIQRGFQACSQILSVANDMIQQLFAIRGQS
jgi:flagellar hook protein FlgE